MDLSENRFYSLGVKAKNFDATTSIKEAFVAGVQASILMNDNADDFIELSEKGMNNFLAVEKGYKS